MRSKQVVAVIYKSSPKHKSPKGFGTTCPHMSDDEAQTLLNGSIAVPAVSVKKRWNAQGEWLFCAHHTVSDEWHGYPVLGSSVDERVLRELCDAAYITAQQMKRFRRQRTFPEPLR